MKPEDQNNGSYIQCQNCGELFYTQKNISIETTIIKIPCPRCGYKRGLNCGKCREDVYEFMNINLDKRYYRY